MSLSQRSLYEKVKLHQQCWALQKGIEFDKKGYVVGEDCYEALKRNLFYQAMPDKEDLSWLKKHSHEFKKFHGSRKVLALHSSAALVLNAFCPWKKNKALSCLSLNPRAFECMRLEELCPTGTEVRGDSAYAHLDLLLCDSNVIVGVESKFAEILSSRQNKGKKEIAFSESYEKPCALGCARLRNKIEKEVGKYNHLDAAQLVKHYLGLRNCIRTGGKYERHKAVLCYLFWEPSNSKDISEYKEHGNEIKKFRKVIRILQEQDSSHKVEFMAKSYLDLWDEWEKTATSEWQKQHLDWLHDRYQFPILGCAASD
jgi:hypothetical protein